MSIRDGGLAFPSESLEELHCGMTLRDYFAAKALALGGEWFHNNAADGSADIAETAYQIADAMIAARKKGRA